MSNDLLQALKKGGHATQTRHWKGLLPGLTSGGTSPRRLLNLAWLAFRSCFGLLLGSKNRVVIVRSTPPLLHLPVATICRWRGIRCVFWLMDYHPVIEQRMWGHKAWLSPFLRWLDRWDRRELSSFSDVVVLDQAMAVLVTTRNPSANVIIHPTWGNLRHESVNLKPEAENLNADSTPPKVSGLKSHPSPPSASASSDSGSSPAITFAYLGNFGQGHGWATLSACIRETSRLRRVRLLCIGVPAAAEPAFAALALETGANLELHPRMDFAPAAALLQERSASWGCVAMKAELAGCLSPSKFSGYLAAGVPLLYAGPPQTNAWQVCVKFGGGVALDDSAKPEEITNAAKRLAEESIRLNAVAGASRAREHFDSFNGTTLAHLLTQR